MRKSLRNQLKEEPAWLECKYGNGGKSQGVLYLDNLGVTKFKWQGTAINADVLAHSSLGYVRFPVFGGEIEPLSKLLGFRTVKPEYTLLGDSREVVEGTVYGRLTVVFNNIFAGSVNDIHKELLIDLTAHLQQHPIEWGDLKLNVYISGSSMQAVFPRAASYVLDKLRFEFNASTESIKVSDVRKIVRRLREVITLITKVPCDPNEIILGNKRRSSEHYLHARYEEGEPVRYADFNIPTAEALEISSGAHTLLRCVEGALMKESGMLLSQWYGYCESKKNKHYLDSITSNLLGCAEAMFYLLPSSSRSLAREEEYGKLEKVVSESEDVSLKLAQWVRGRKRDYVESKPYSEKIRKLIKYSNVDVSDVEVFVKYANQLRMS